MTATTKGTSRGAVPASSGARAARQAPPQPDRLRPGRTRAHDAPRSGWARHWPWIRRVLPWVFLALVIALVTSQARELDWQEVRRSVARYEAVTLAIAAGIGALSYALYSCYDLLSRRYAGHQLPVARVLAVTFVSYAFNLNLGSLVGGVGFRLRLYSRLGLDQAQISRVLGFSVLTNWLGYLLLAGAVFVSGTVELPDEWKLGSTGLRLLGGALLAIAAAYFGVCAFSPRREFVWRGHELLLPSWRLALAQFALSACNWLAIACVLYVLFRQQLAFGTVVAVLMVSAVAGVVTHVPAGLGVLEAVFIGLLSWKFSRTELIATLVAYRAVYYLAPLVVAALLYGVLEWRARHLRVR